jgi:hypothetical protein
MRVDHVFEELMPVHLRQSAEPVRPRNFECLKQSIDTYESACGKLSDYDLQYVKYLVQACETMPDHTFLDQVLARITTSCSH